MATAISGIASYVVTWLVPRHVGLANYAIFAVFWSSMYLVVGALSGIQQEVTRGTLPIATARASQVNRARNFGIVAALSVFALILATAPLWQKNVFPANGLSLVLPLAFGAGSFVLVAVLAGSLYGVGELRSLALMMTTDALLRLGAVALVLAFTINVVALAWAVALPFPVAVITLWPFIRHGVVGHTELDVNYRALAWNVARTIIAAASTGVMVSGFPLILGLTSRSEPGAIVGLYVLTITLTRAPLIIVAMSLQSYFLVSFRDYREHFWRQFAVIISTIIGAGLLLAGAGWCLGPAVFGFLFPGALRPSGPLIGALVLSSALVGILCVSAPAVLARSQHFVYSAGWLVAAIVTIAALLLPIDFSHRVVLALLSGPVMGLLVHAGYLAGDAIHARRKEPKTDGL